MEPGAAVPLPGIGALPRAAGLTPGGFGSADTRSAETCQGTRRGENPEACTRPARELDDLLKKEFGKDLRELNDQHR